MRERITRRLDGPVIMSSAARARAAIVALLVVGCSGPHRPLPPAPAVVQVTMRDYHLDHDAQVPQGRVLFDVSNAGRNRHRLSLIALPPDSPPADELIRGHTPHSVTPFASIPNILPGESDSFAVDLAPGRYELIDLGMAPDHESYALKGMVSEIRAS